MAKQIQFHRLIGSFFDKYLPKVRNLSTGTIDIYNYTLRLYMTWVEKHLKINHDAVGAEHFTLSLLERYIEHLRSEGLSNKTINVRLSAIKSFVSYCYREDLRYGAMLAEVDSVKLPTEPKSDAVKYLTVEQLKLLLTLPDTSTRKGYRDLTFLAVTYWTGCRVSEMLKLRMSDVSHGENGSLKLKITGKGNKVREVFVMLDGAKILKGYIKKFHNHSNPGDPLFYSYHDGLKTPLSRSAAHKIIKNYVKQAIERDPDFPPETHMHTLRHSFATHLHEQGTPLSYIKDLLGHSSLQSTTIYAKSSPETIKKELAKARHMVSDSLKRLKSGDKRVQEDLD